MPPLEEWARTCIRTYAHVCTHALARPVLQALVLDGCLHVGNAGLEAVARHCHGLQELSVAKCFHINGTGMQVRLGVLEVQH
jgi:hypothetical protein